MAPSREEVVTALKAVEDPVSGGDIMGSGVVRALNVDESGAVRFVMEIPPPPRLFCREGCCRGAFEGNGRKRHRSS